MKKNRGFTLVEAIIVLASFSMVMLLIWTMLNSASEDTYTLNDKVEVQNSVTSLMNIIQQDIQEAKIYNIHSTNRGIIDDRTEDVYIFYNNLKYEFDKNRKMVIRSENGTAAEYHNIVEFEITPVDAENYGAKVSIVGGKKPIDDEGVDKSRYTLNSTFYTRNTI